MMSQIDELNFIFLTLKKKLPVVIFPSEMYITPKQPRAIETERRFLESMDMLLVSNSYSKLSIEMIAEHAHLQKGAFLNRFGSKKQALFLLFRLYCEECYSTINEISQLVPNTTLSLNEMCASVSSQFEQLLIKNFSANRAMYECFAEDLEVHELTKGIFKSCVAMMLGIQNRYGLLNHEAKGNAFAATQLLVTINFNVVMKAMPAMPIEKTKRHKLIGNIIAEALTFKS